MIDSSLDPDFAALERADSQRAAEPVRRRAPATLATLPARPPARTGVLAAESSAVVPPPEPAPPDPLGHLRAARLGFAAVVLLICYWLWIRRNRT